MAVVQVKSKSNKKTVALATVKFTYLDTDYRSFNKSTWPETELFYFCAQKINKSVLYLSEIKHDNKSLLVVIY